MENAYAVSRFLLSGSGGQGVITMAILLAEAAVKYEGLVAVQSQSYGPEARGGATRSDVILSNKAINYPRWNSRTSSWHSPMRPVSSTCR